MPNVNANVGLDNYTQSGDQTLQQLQSGIAAQTGVAPGVAEQVRDPNTGKLIKVVLTMPDTAAAQASAVIAANKGVSTVVTAAPQLLLDDVDHIECGESLTRGAGGGMTIAAFSRNGDFFGQLSGVTGSDVWTDGSELISALPLKLQFVHGDDLNQGTPWVIPTSTLIRIHTSATQYLDLVRTSSLSVDYGSYDGQPEIYWVATDGKMYLAIRNNDNITYEEAIQFPPA